MSEENIYSAPESAVITVEDTSVKPYAVFWQRLLAIIIDTLVLFGVGLLLGGIMIGVTLLTGLGELTSSIIEFVLSLIIGWLYFALMESSAAQATLGKMALGIKVTDLERQPVSFGKATGRHFGTYLSVLILFVGYFIQPFTQRKQTLHDLMAGCVVVVK